MESALAKRQNMALGQLYTNEITDRRILQAMVDVPREPFVPAPLNGAAYVDGDIDMGNGRFMLAPLTFAKLLQLAEITPACRILNIGCLSGYSAAILKQLGGHVVAVDNDKEWVGQTREHLQRLKIKRDVDVEQVGSLPDGYGKSAPYNVIVVCGAVSFVPEILGAQLAIGGRLVAIRNVSERPGLRGGLGKGLLVKRIDHRLQYREYFDASTAVLPGFA